MTPYADTPGLPSPIGEGRPSPAPAKNQQQSVGTEFGAFYLAHSRELNAYAARMLTMAQVASSQLSAEDVVAEAMMTMMKNWERLLADEVPLRRYAFRVVKNMVVTQARQRQRKEAVHLDVQPLDDHTQESAEQSVIRNIDHDNIRAAFLSALTPHEQQVALLCYAEDLSSRAAAERLGISSSGIRRTLAQIKRKLTRSLGSAIPT
ncbi:sigma-70 family RNA polymerase sigma factor (plasmid) [Streptomyces sp. NBC_00111]|uniref:RNA polymerase sigma factor n=1 Tax=Streptomyces sp. NBC_00111 TaxID=2975655 RepID=UPI002F914D59